MSRNHPERDGEPTRTALRAGALGIGAALLVTLAIGFALRWFLAGRLVLTWDFGSLIHAHSHLGYYAVLFPLAWLGWREAGAATPGPRVLTVYAIATVVAWLGFMRAGYGVEAIAASAVVGGVWLVSAWAQRGRTRDWRDPLATVLPGVIVAEACIPPIAVYLRTDPMLARAFVASFLAALLLVVIVPSALAARRLAAPWPGLLLGGIAGAAALGVWPALPARLGLGGYAALLAWVVLRGGLAAHLAAAWLAAAGGMLAMALGVVPNTHPVVIGAIHFLVLGPILASLAPCWLRADPPAWAWWLGHACVGALAAPLVAQGLGAGPWTMTVSALGGTAVVVWWVSVLVLQLKAPPPGREPTGSART